MVFQYGLLPVVGEVEVEGDGWRLRLESACCVVVVVVIIVVT